MTTDNTSRAVDRSIELLGTFRETYEV